VVVVVVVVVSGGYGVAIGFLGASAAGAAAGAWVADGGEGVGFIGAVARGKRESRASWLGDGYVWAPRWGRAGEFQDEQPMQCFPCVEESQRKRRSVLHCH